MQVMTKVEVPYKRVGNGFSVCGYCGNVYTTLGISRHMNSCPKRRKSKTKAGSVRKN